MNQPDTGPCPICHGLGYVYTSRHNAGWYEPCQRCKQPATKLPWWVEPLGQSILHPTLRDNDGGALEVEKQT